MGAVCVTKRNEPDRGKRFISRWMGTAVGGPFKPSDRAFFFARWSAVLRGPRNVRALLVHPPG